MREINDKKMGIAAVIGAQGKVVGAITDGDIRRFLLRGRAIESTRAKEVMTTHPKCVQAIDSLEQALVVMENHKITNAFVLDTRERLAGIIRLHDIVEHSIR